MDARARVAGRHHLARVRRVPAGPDVQLAQRLGAGRAAGVRRAEHGLLAVERVLAGRLVRRHGVHVVPAAVHAHGGAVQRRGARHHRVQGARVAGRAQPAGPRVRPQLAAVRPGAPLVPGVRVVDGRRVRVAHAAHQRVAAVPAVPVRGLRQHHAAVLLLQRVPAELEHVLHGDALRAAVLLRVPAVPRHQRRAVGRPHRRHGQQQVPDALCRKPCILQTL